VKEVDGLILVYWEDFFGCGWGLAEPGSLGILAKHYVGLW
jgi:hypothetical protein